MFLLPLLSLVILCSDFDLSDLQWAGKGKQTEDETGLEGRMVKEIIDLGNRSCEAQSITGLYIFSLTT